jgi:uncharacterized OB-fold protein
MINYNEVKYSKTNRQKKQTPKFTTGWCGKCDANYLTGYQKCPVCGRRNRAFTLKKEPLCA